jgi:hypothetical protein
MTTVFIPTIGEDLDTVCGTFGSPIIQFIDLDKKDLRRLEWEEWKADGFKPDRTRTRRFSRARAGALLLHDR